MTEDFVPYKLAVKLKEKGYPQHIAEDAYIVDNYGEEDYQIGDRLPIPLVPDYMDDVAAPTISQVLKWLREEKHLFADISLCVGGYYGYIYSTIFQKDKDFSDGWMFDGKYDTYESAALAGIEYTLYNLI